MAVDKAHNIEHLNRSLHSKVVECAEGVVKKPKEDAIRAMTARTTRGFENMGDGRGSVEHQDKIMSLVRAGAGEAFDQAGMQLPDISVLGAASAAAAKAKAESDALEAIQKLQDDDPSKSKGGVSSGGNIGVDEPASPT